MLSCAGVDASVSVGGRFFDASGGVPADGAMGFAMHDIEFGLALLKPVDSTDHTSYYALVASAGQISLVGVPGLILSATHLDVAINGASVAGTGGVTATAPPVVDFTASFGTTGLLVGSVSIKLSSRIIAASGQALTLGLDFNTDGITEISLSADVSFEKLTRPNGSEVIKVALQRSEEHTSELQSPCNLVCRLLLEKKNERD